MEGYQIRLYPFLRHEIRQLDRWHDYRFHIFTVGVSLITLHFYIKPGGHDVN